MGTICFERLKIRFHQAHQPIITTTPSKVLPLFTLITTGHNSKKRKVAVPIPNTFFKKLESYVEENQLKNTYPLLYGLKGEPLRQKMLNRIVEKLCDYLNWNDGKRITPYSFRYSIATILDEKSVALDSISFLIGHSEKVNKSNIHRYLRSNRKKLKELRFALNELEEELESYVGNNAKQTHNNNYKQEGTDNSTITITEEDFVELMKTNKEAALALAKKYDIV